MADCGEQQAQQVEDVEDETKAAEYKAPAPKSIEEILNTDKEDESLKKYKETLLGGTGGTGSEKVFCKLTN